MSNTEHSLPKFPNVSLEREQQLRERLNEFVSRNLFQKAREKFSSTSSAKVILEEASLLEFHGRVFFLIDQFDCAPLDQRAGWTYTILDEQEENSPALNQMALGPEWWTKKQILELGEEMTVRFVNTPLDRVDLEI